MAEDEGSKSAICWERVGKKLELYAYRITGHPKEVDKDGPVEYTIGEAVDPLDLVSQVLTRFLTGGIRSNPAEPLTERYLVNLLKRALSSAYIDLLRKIESRKTDYTEDLRRPTDDDEGGRDFFDSYKVQKVSGFKRHQIISDPLPAPNEDDLLVKYREELNALYERVKGDTPLEEVVRAICEEELEEPREIAAHLKTSPHDIYNRLKRLRRRYGDLLPLRRKQRKAI